MVSVSGFNGRRMVFVERERDDRISGEFLSWSMRMANLPKPRVEGGFYRVSGREERRDKEWVLVFWEYFWCISGVSGMYVRIEIVADHPQTLPCRKSHD